MWLKRYLFGSDYFIIKRPSKYSLVLIILCSTYVLVSRSKWHSVSQTASTLVYRSSFCQCDRQVNVKMSLRQNPINWCSEEATMRGPGQNVLSYSIYGDSIKDNKTTRYYSIIQDLPKQAKQRYPDWRMRIYHDVRPNQTRQHEILCNTYCQNDNVDLCDVNQMMESLSRIRNGTRQSLPVLSEDLAKFNRMNWRYLPMIDPLVDRLLPRDTDSEINDREVVAVREWLNSDLTFHIMRDHPQHVCRIMGGMFGVKVYQKRELIEGLTKAMIYLGTSQGYGFDQQLLANLFWPNVKDDAVIHDSYYCEKDWNSGPIWPYSTRRDQATQTFVTDRAGSDWIRPGPCPVACRPADHRDWVYC